MEPPRHVCAVWGVGRRRGPRKAATGRAALQDTPRSRCHVEPRTRGSVRGRRCWSPRAPRADSDRGPAWGSGGRSGRQSSTLTWCVRHRAHGGGAPQPGTPRHPESWETGEGRCPQAPGARRARCSPRPSSESQGQHWGPQGPPSASVPPLVSRQETGRGAPRREAQVQPASRASSTAPRQGAGERMTTETGTSKHKTGVKIKEMSQLQASTCDGAGAAKAQAGSARGAAAAQGAGHTWATPG